VRRFRAAPRAPLAVAGILATPLFFTALMAMSLAVEKPAVVGHVLRHGRMVAKLGDPVGSTERTIWLLAILPPVALLLVGALAMLLGRLGVVASALAAVAATVVLLVPLHTWTARHTTRYPVGIDLVPRSAASDDIYLRGEWEGRAQTTARQLGAATIVIAGLAVVVLGLLEVRRRRGLTGMMIPPPPAVAEGQSQIVRGGLGRRWFGR
jgi:hypothetical protein